MPAPVQTTNPFPGMNPYLERFWPDVHTVLIGYIRDAISGDLPPDLKARVEERVSIDDEQQERQYIPDVSIEEAWRGGRLPPTWAPSPDAGGGIAAAKPQLIVLDESKERWVEVRDRAGNLVTAIELISPSNKRPPGVREYRARQTDFIEAGISLVEIDLIRAGRPVFRVPPDSIRGRDDCGYAVSVSRACLPRQHEVYACPLRQRLPAIRIPLRPDDRDVVLDLQPLIDKAYANGRYWMEDYSERLAPPLSADDRAWADERLREANLTGTDA